MPLIRLPISGKKDFRIRHLGNLCANDYTAFDHGGNKFSLAAWLARAKSNCTAEVITEILAGQITFGARWCRAFAGPRREKKVGWCAPAVAI